MFQIVRVLVEIEHQIVLETTKGTVLKRGKRLILEVHPVILITVYQSHGKKEVGNQEPRYIGRINLETESHI